MNEDAPAQPGRPHPHRSIEDNYPEYLEQSYGYAYEVADVLSQAEIARHEKLTHATAAELDGVDLDGLSDLDRWTVARARRRLGQFDRYLEICSKLLDSDQEHPVVVYSEISRWVALDLADAGRLGAARQRLKAHLQRWEGDVQARELIGIIEFIDADGDDGYLKELAAEFPGDAELRFEIAEDLWRFGRVEAANDWVNQARRAAEASGDRAALVDIELLAERIANAPASPEPAAPTAPSAESPKSDD